MNAMSPEEPNSEYPLATPEVKTLLRLRDLEAIESPTEEQAAQARRLRPRVQALINGATYREAAEATIRVRWKNNDETQDWTVSVEADRTPHEALPAAMQVNQDRLPEGWEQGYVIEWHQRVSVAEPTRSNNHSSNLLDDTAPPLPALFANLVGCLSIFALIIALVALDTTPAARWYLAASTLPVSAILFAAGATVSRLDRIARATEKRRE